MNHQRLTRDDVLEVGERVVLVRGPQANQTGTYLGITDGLPTVELDKPFMRANRDGTEVLVHKVRTSSINQLARLEVKAAA